VIAVVSAPMLAGCTIAPGIRASGMSSAVDDPDNDFAPGSFDAEVRRITPHLLARYNRASAEFNPSRNPGRAELTNNYSYRVGIGDVLNVIVWEHPELTNPAGVTTGELREQGRLVREDGTFFFPFIGAVEAAGRSVDEIRHDLSEGLRVFIDDPQIDVRVTDYRSQYIYVTGEVNEPGPVPIDDRPLTMLDAVARAGGFGENADRRRAYLTRDDGRRHVDILSLYESGSEDELLRHGDVLHIPDNHFNQVIVMGEVVNQSRVPIHSDGRLSLAEAIVMAEGVDLTTADTSRIVVIRGEPVHSENGAMEGVRPIVYYLDSRQASDLLLAEGFQLQPRDIVFIPASTAVNINRTIDQILPPIASAIQAIWMTDALIRR
jgi:polysaccharide biosynthesis/export protein